MTTAIAFATGTLVGLIAGLFLGTIASRESSPRC